MKSFRALALIAVFSTAGLLAPDSARAQFTEDSRYAGFHVGMSGVGSTASIGVQGEVAYNERISIGGWIDTWSYGQSFTVLGSNNSWNTRYVAIAGTGSYHFPIEGNEKLDPFVGLSLGYYVVSASASGATSGVYTGSASRMFLGGQAGVRYYFKENMTGLAMLGVGASYLTVGMDFGL